jgi:hypothetical protein
MDKTWLCQLSGAHAAAGSIACFQHHHTPACLRQMDRRGKPVMSRAHHNGIALRQFKSGQFVWHVRKDKSLLGTDRSNQDRRVHIVTAVKTSHRAIHAKTTVTSRTKSFEPLTSLLNSSSIHDLPGSVRVTCSSKLY